MGSCFASAPKQDNNPIKRPSKLKVVIPKNPLLDSTWVYNIKHIRYTKKCPFELEIAFN